jgi:hypothetical protein
VNKNTNLTQLDPNQVTRAEHDSLYDAKRVILVGGEKLDISIDSNKIADAVKDALNFQGLIESNEPHFNVITVEKQVFIPQIEYKIIEVPVIVKEIEYREIEKPVYITEYKTLEISTSNESMLKEVPMLFKVLLGGHALTWLGLLISHFIK